MHPTSKKHIEYLELTGGRSRNENAELQISTIASYPCAREADREGLEIKSPNSVSPWESKEKSSLKPADSNSDVRWTRSGSTAVEPGTFPTENQAMPPSQGAPVAHPQP